MITTKDYDLNKMNSSEVETLWVQVKSVYDHHFGVAFAADYLNKKCEEAQLARLRVMWHQQKPVGVLLLFGYKVKVNNQHSIVYRSSAAVDQGFRSKNNLISFLFKHVAWHAVKHSHVRQYIIEGSIHPSSYIITQRNAYQTYPSCDHPTPPAIQQVIESVAQANILTGYRFEHEHPFVATYPCNTSQTVDELIAWQNKIKTDRHMAFYHRIGATENHRAVVSVTPVTLKNIVLSWFKIRKNKAQYKATKQQAQALATAS